MKAFEATPKKWGNSLGVVIPKQVVEEAKLSTKKKVRIFIAEQPKLDWKKVFGTIHGGKATQDLLDEIDKELYPDG